MGQPAITFTSQKRCAQCGRALEAHLAREKTRFGYNYYCSFRCFQRRREPLLSAKSEDLIPSKVPGK